MVALEARARRRRSRCSRSGRRSMPGPDARRRAARAADCVPIRRRSRSDRRARARARRCRRPTPVPRIAPNTTSAPSPAPSVASDSAKQLASLLMRTSRAERRLEVALDRLAVEAHRIRRRARRPVAREIEPGVPMPTVPVAPSSRSAAATRRAIASIIGAIVAHGRGDAAAQHLCAACDRARRSRSWFRPSRRRSESSPYPTVTAASQRHSS